MIITLEEEVEKEKTISSSLVVQDKTENAVRAEKELFLVETLPSKDSYAFVHE